MFSHSASLLTLIVAVALASCGGETGSPAEEKPGSTTREIINNTSPSFLVAAIQESLDVL